MVGRRSSYLCYVYSKLRYVNMTILRIIFYANNVRSWVLPPLVIGFQGS